jgi:hypothetical protein
MKYNNTRLQCLLKLYYKQQPNSAQDHNIYFVYKSVFKTYKYGNNWPSQYFLYKTLWTDIKDFFAVFYLDFVSIYLSSGYRHFNRKPENYSPVFKFCDDYFKWLSQKFSEKGKVSFEEVREKIIELIK